MISLVYELGRICLVDRLQEVFELFRMAKFNGAYKGLTKFTKDASDILQWLRSQFHTRREVTSAVQNH
jgi:hypothetical protein